MCDGHRDEINWTLRSRQTGQLIVTTSGHSYVFSDEFDAYQFADEHHDSRDVEVIPLVPPE